MTLFSEYEDAFGRPKLWEKSLLSASECDEVFNGFLSVCRWVKVFYAWRPNLPDEADNHRIELALAGNANAQSQRSIRLRTAIPIIADFNTRTMQGGLPMSTLTIRLPDDKHERLRALAEKRHISVNKLIDKLATIMIPNFDLKYGHNKAVLNVR